ncbi:Phenol hydroxylase P2 protein [Paraburkholderia caffeinitolerans]|uniref:Phenol hydroxylase P2 protein n=1 Tax=Paraburkholderia caffeinitolerans TaxID=1723730 RepID=A0A6J5G0U9_9BURK|nr:MULTISPECIES: MmoB/DmpM family protein [Paraburkholderia]CAB3788669.1 Phenol hydroxylase P2 protein [Paraburkholderia caffeinitolerans]
MNTVQSTVFLALQTNDETRPLIEAIEADNPHAVVHRMPAMVKIDAPGRLVVRRSTIEAITGMDFDLQSFQVNLISLSGNLDETEDELVLEWKR